jgi:glutathione S-transferase
MEVRVVKLVGTYLSPFSRRVAASLISRDIFYTLEDVNGYLSPEKARALNPVGKVPVLILDDGEAIIDSGAILDHLNEVCRPEQALIPPLGRARRAVLRASAIATTIYEQSTARFFEERRPVGSVLPELIERYRQQTIGGLKALEEASRPGGPIAAGHLNLATISAVVAVDYVRITHADLDPGRLAPALSSIVSNLADKPPFALTRPPIS